MSFKPKLWLTLGAALTLTAACSEQGEAGGEAGSGEGGPAAVSGEGEGGEGEGGEGEGGASAGVGEAGAAAGYAGVPAESLLALRLAHLTGFFLVAQEALPAEGEAAAAALAGQGLAEVYDPVVAQFATADLDEAVLRQAAESGSAADLEAAVAELERARRAAGGDPGVVAGALADISAGIYREVLVDGAVDPVEYQHALGAALAAQAVAEGAPGLAPARAQIDRLVAMWPSVTAPEAANGLVTAAQVQAQASRIRLEASS
ncbi:hypothetical protein [Brevundimonas sp.]|uniref:hypothetical protein n=1 Tax=Brevundimonas sp. TaxID=1871086 RepID=UPI0025D96439|nr:hypothetical protein [Brevundimonas sp.]